MFISEDKLKKWIQDAVIEALTVEIDWEKTKDEKTGLPLKHPERRREKVFLPAFITQLLPYHEGSLRGMQETVDREVKNSIAFANKVEAIGNILLGHEENLLKFARFIAYVENKGLMLPEGEMQLIEAEVVDESSTG